MPDEALQTAFEIKTTCDEISRKLLRWHWENKPGEHSLGALLDHIRTRQQESPEYYDRLPDLAGRNSWQQLDTTLCMRVLLDPEKDAVRPLDLLGNTEHPAAARRACNAVRTARNEAAHASDHTAAAQAAILFNEAVEALEEGYAGAPLRTSELGQYYRLAEDYLSRCGAKKPIASAAPEEKAPRAAKSGQSTAGRKKEGTSGSASRRSSTKQNTSGRSSGGRPQNRKQGGSRNSRARARQKQKQANRTVLLVLLAILAVGLLIRGFGRNLRMTKPLLAYGFDGFVCSAGGYVGCDGKILVDLPMEPAQVEGLREVLGRAGAECTLEARDDTYGGIKMIERFAHLFPRKPGQLNSEAERWCKTMEYGMTIRPIEEYHGEPVYKVVFIAPNEACLAEAKQLYEDQFIFCESRLGDNPSAIVNGELINRKFNKGTGIKAICDELGCSLADTIGFGDSDNDLQMTDVVGISVCMANGSDNLKKLCDRICPAVTEDGVARELKTLGLI